MLNTALRAAHNLNKKEKELMNMKLARFVSVLLTVVLLAGSFPFTKEHHVSAMESLDAYDQLRLKWKDMLTGGSKMNSNDPDIAAAVASLDSQVSNTNGTGFSDTMNRTYDRNGIWNDLESTSVSSQITSTYSRLRSMARVYATPGSSLYNNAALQSDIIGALEWMYKNRYNENSRKYDNWYDWELGSPMNLNDIFVMMYDVLTIEQIERFSRPIHVFSPGIQSSDTGANRVWRATVLALSGVVNKNAGYLAAARDGLSDVFTYATDGDGFYEDGSFIQHNKHPYTGGYGRALLGSVVSILVLLTHSPWEVTDPNQQNVYRWIYDSFEPLIYNGALMDMVRGREVARAQLQEHAAGASVIMAILKLSQAAAPAERLSLQRMVKRWIIANSYYNYRSSTDLDFLVQVKALLADPSIPPADEMVMNTIFPAMDRVVHHRPGFGAGLSLSSSRTYKYEAINNENVKGWYTSDGMLSLYNGDRGQYSEGYWATVNPYRLPSTTVDTRTRSAESIPWGTDVVPTNTWAGGTTLDNMYGVSGLDLDASGSDLTAKKSWFMFDDEIVALGAGITSQSTTPIETIVDNRRLNAAGDNILTINGTVKPNNLGWSETNAAQWAHLSGSVPGSDIGYYFPDGGALKGLREQRTGAWSDINQNSGSPTPITNPFLNLWFDHGTHPNQSSYSYVLLPNKNAAQTAAYSMNPDIEILSNTAATQAVKHLSLGMIGVNFWNPGRVSYIKSYQPASVLVKEEGNELTLSVSDPTQARDYIVLELSKAGSSVISKDTSITVVNTTPNIKIVVNTANSRGRTHTIKISFDPSSLSSKLKLHPAADSYVESANPTANYGDSLSLAINNGNTRQSFMRFDLSNLNREIDNVTLNLHTAITDSKGGSKENSIRQVTQNDWIESGPGSLVWNNKPPIGAQLGTFIATPDYQWMGLNVTDYVYAQYQLRKHAGFAIIQTGSGLFTTLHSKEYTDPAFRPYLEVEGYAFIGPQLHQIDLTIGQNVLKVGTSSQVKVVGKLEDGLAADLLQASITFSSEQPSILSVDNSGNVHSLSTGTSRITATVSLNGVTRTASIQVISAVLGLETNQVQVSADAYVASGSPQTNYGSAPTLAVTNASGNVREAYFKFDTSDVKGSVYAAKLMLYASNTDSKGGEKENKLYALASNNWDESSLTWNNKPAAGRLLTSSVITPGYTWQEFDVTSYIQEQMNSDRMAGFTLRQDGAALFTSIYSKERPSERPYLWVQSYRLQNEWSGFTVKADSVFMKTGQSQTLQPQGSMDDGTAVQFPATAVSYTSSKPDVLMVDSNGHMTALKPGKSTVVATAGMNGVSKTAAIEIIVPVSGPYVTSLAPEADTYVRKDAYAETNFGTKPQLDVNNTSSGYPTQQAYLRFNLTGLSGNELYSSQLYVSAATTNGLKEVGVYKVQDDSWVENGMTWNNKPSIGTEALSSVQVNNTWSLHNFDVTSYTRAEYTGDQRISLALSQQGPGNYVGVKSRKNTPADTRPYLQVITYQLSDTEPQVQWSNNATLTAAAISSGRVLLSWTQADNGKTPNGYSIYKRSVGDSVYSRVYSASAAGFNVLGAVYGYEVDGLLPGTYVFKVEALDSHGNKTTSGPSAQITVAALAANPKKPTRPVGVLMVPDRQLRTNSLRLLSIVLIRNPSSSFFRYN
jgi:hyaluronate lyase